MYAAVVREGTDRGEGDRPRLIRIQREVERTTRRVGGHGVELAAAVHERHDRAAGDRELAREEGPPVLLAPRLKDLDLIRLMRLMRRSGHGCARGRRDEEDARDHA